MLKKYGALGSSAPKEEMSVRERLRQKIREKEQTRLGKEGQELMKQREHERLQKEREAGMQGQRQLTDGEKAEKEKARMKRLRKLFKTVSEEDYFSSLEQLQNLILNPATVKKDVLQRHQNIVDLYNYQQRNQTTERELDLELDDA